MPAMDTSVAQQQLEPCQPCLQGKRDPTQPELNATTVLSLDMEEVSAKVSH